MFDSAFTSLLRSLFYCICVSFAIFLLLTSGNTNVLCRYIGRLSKLLQNFGTRFSCIDAIHQKALAAERLRAKSKWWHRLLSCVFRFTPDSATVLRSMADLDENQVIKLTTDAVGEKLRVHRDFEARHRINSSEAVTRRNSVLRPSLSQNANRHKHPGSTSYLNEHREASLSPTRAAAITPAPRRRPPNVKIELEEVVVHSASRSGQREKEAPAADVAALKLQTSATAVDSTRSNLQLVRGASVAMKTRAHHSIKEDEFKLDKQRYEQVAARAALKQRTAASSAPKESDAHIQSVSSDDAPPMYPPPPFDEDDFKLAKRREEKAAARAALKQRAAAATVLEDSNAHAQRVSSDDAPPMYPPPPFDEDDLKLAKRREEKAAARAALKQTFTVATAFGSSLTKNSESTRFNSC